MKKDSIFLNHSFDKKRLKALIFWVLQKCGEEEALRVVEQLKDTGFQHARLAGISIGVHDLTTPSKKPSIVAHGQSTMNLTHQDFSGARITSTERSQRIIDTWHRASEDMRSQVVDHFTKYDPFNSVYIMALSGARGNFAQVRQLIGMRGLMADQQGKIVSFPIRSNLREGLSLTEYFISCSGARKGLVDTALRTADTGYLTRRLVDVSHHVVVKRVRCSTHRRISVQPLYSYNKVVLTLKERLIGRVLAEEIGGIASIPKERKEERKERILEDTRSGSTEIVTTKSEQEVSLYQENGCTTIKDLEPKKLSFWGLLPVLLTNNGSTLLRKASRQKLRFWSVYDVNPPRSSFLSRKKSTKLIRITHVGLASEAFWQLRCYRLTGEACTLSAPTYFKKQSAFRTSEACKQLLSFHMPEDGGVLDGTTRSSASFYKHTFVLQSFVLCFAYKRTLYRLLLKKSSFLQNKKLDFPHKESEKRVRAKLHFFPPTKETVRAISQSSIQAHSFPRLASTKKTNRLGSVQAPLDEACTFLTLAEKDQEISSELALEIARIRHKVYIRSPLTCQFTNSVCQLCYGWSVSQGSLVSLGEAVGVIAAQSIGEPGTQLTMRTFHTGGVFSGDLLQEIRAPHSGKIQFSQAFQGLIIRTAHGRIAFLTKVAGELVLLSTHNKTTYRNLISDTNKMGKETRLSLPAMSMLFVRQGEHVEKNQLLAEISILTQEGNQPIKSQQTLFAELSGKVVEDRTGITVLKEIEEDSDEDLEDDTLRFIEPKKSNRLGLFQVLGLRAGATFSYRHPIIKLRTIEAGKNTSSNTFLNPGSCVNRAFQGKMYKSNTKIFSSRKCAPFTYKQSFKENKLLLPSEAYKKVASASYKKPGFVHVKNFCSGRTNFMKKYAHPEILQSNSACLHTIAEHGDLVDEKYKKINYR